MSSPMLQDELHEVLPVVNTQGSDSAMLDNTLEFLTMSGMDLPLAVMITIPEPWANNDTISQEKRDFYQYYATMMEPWDGPASILFSDGDIMGAVLDRNGLRPSRYYVTNDGYLILSSSVMMVTLRLLLSDNTSMTILLICSFSPLMKSAAGHEGAVKVMSRSTVASSFTSIL